MVLHGHFLFPGGADPEMSRTRSWADKEGSACRYDHYYDPIRGWDAALYADAILFWLCFMISWVE